MLTKINRLTKDKEFDNIFKNGYSSYDKAIGVRMSTNQRKINRFGILVNSKVSRQAVERNRIKRQIREILKSQLEKIKAGYDIIIIVLPGAREKNYVDLEQSVKKHYIKLGLYKKQTISG